MINSRSSGDVQWQKMTLLASGAVRNRKKLPAVRNSEAGQGRPDRLITWTVIASPGCTVMHCKARPETEVNSPSLGLNTHLAARSAALKALGGVLRFVQGIRAGFGRDHL